MSTAVGISVGTTGYVVRYMGSDNTIATMMNEASKRKTQAMVSFSKGERFFSEAAASMEQSNYKNTIKYLKKVLGKTSKDSDSLGEISRFPNRGQFVTTEEGSFGCEVEHGESKIVVGVTEAVAMQLTNLREMATKCVQDSSDAHSGGAAAASPFRAVFTVPTYYTAPQRRALLDAAKIANIEVSALLTESAAVALAYGWWANERGAFEGSTNSTLVLFVDMGAADTTVTLAEYTKNACRIRACACDENLGGRNIDDVLLDRFAADFENSKLGSSAARREFREKSARPLLKLRAAAEKAKITLTPDGVTRAEFTVDSVFDGIDYRVLLPLEEFDALIKPFTHQLTKLVERCLIDANVLPHHLFATEILGGSTRLRQMKHAIANALQLPHGSRTPPNYGVSSTLNSEEALAEGAVIWNLLKGRDVYNLLDYPYHTIQITTGIPRAPSTSSHFSHFLGESAVGEDEENVAFPTVVASRELYVEYATPQAAKSKTTRGGRTLLKILPAYINSESSSLVLLWLQSGPGEESSSRPLAARVDVGLPSWARNPSYYVQVEWGYDSNGLVSIYKYEVCENPSGRFVQALEARIKPLGLSPKALQRSIEKEAEFARVDEEHRLRKDAKNALEKTIYALQRGIADELTRSAEPKYLQSADALRNELKEKLDWIESGELEEQNVNVRVITDTEASLRQRFENWRAGTGNGSAAAAASAAAADGVPPESSSTNLSRSNSSSPPYGLVTNAAHYPSRGVTVPPVAAPPQRSNSNNSLAPNIPPPMAPPRFFMSARSKVLYAGYEAKFGEALKELERTRDGLPVLAGEMRVLKQHMQSFLDWLKEQPPIPERATAEHASANVAGDGETAEEREARAVIDLRFEMHMSAVDVIKNRIRDEKNFKVFLQKMRNAAGERLPNGQYVLPTSSRLDVEEECNVDEDFYRYHVHDAKIRPASAVVAKWTREIEDVYQRALVRNEDDAYYNNTRYAKGGGSATAAARAQAEAQQRAREQQRVAELETRPAEMELTFDEAETRGGGKGKRGVSGNNGGGKTKSWY